MMKLFFTAANGSSEVVIAEINNKSGNGTVPFKKNESSIHQKSRGNFLTFLIFAFAVVSIFVYTGCKKDKKEDPIVYGTGLIEVDEKGLTRDIRELVPDYILEEIEDLGMPIYGGNTPPDITGTFLGSPLVLVASNFNDAYQPGQRFADLTVTYYEQNNQKLTIKVLEEQGSSTGVGTGGFIVGTSMNFTIFVGLDNVRNGHEYKTVSVYSGIISDEGIQDLYLSLLMLDDGGDPNNNLIENGQGRLFYDSDGLSERITSSEKSSVQTSEKLYPDACFKSDE